MGYHATARVRVIHEPTGTTVEIPVPRAGQTLSVLDRVHPSISEIPHRPGSDATATPSAPWPAPTPVVFDGAAREWPLCTKWTFEYFKTVHGGVEVAVIPDRLHAPTKLDLKSYIEAIEAGKYRRDTGAGAGHPNRPPYLRGWRFEDDAPEMLADFQVPPFVDDHFQHLPRQRSRRFGGSLLDRRALLRGCT